MILSSRCGRGRLARMANNFSRLFASESRISCSLFLKCCSRLCDRVAFDQNIFAAEFIVRIASLGRVAVRLHTVMEIENLSGVAERIVDFFFCPDIERTFGSFAVAGSPSQLGGQSAGYNRAVGIFGGEKAAILRCHVTSDVIENVARD